MLQFVAISRLTNEHELKPNNKFPKNFSQKAEDLLLLYIYDYNYVYVLVNFCIYVFCIVLF